MDQRATRGAEDTVCDTGASRLVCRRCPFRSGCDYRRRLADPSQFRGSLMAPAAPGKKFCVVMFAWFCVGVSLAVILLLLNLRIE